MTKDNFINDNQQTPVYETLIGPDAILSGIGLMNRHSLCVLISVLESIDILGLVRGMADEVTRLVARIDDKDICKVEAAANELEASSLSTAVLRHRLWNLIARGVAAESAAPFSVRSAHQSASALAVRASERLSPQVLRRRNKETGSDNTCGQQSSITETVASTVRDARKYFAKSEPLTFSDIVTDEFMSILSDDATFSTILQSADSDTRDALSRARMKAKAAMAGGAGWAAFAGVVASSGFAPYILAAKVSAFLPLVSGPGLVSLLAVLVNPATLAVGLGGLAWLGAGKSTDAARSQVSARLCVMLAIRGHENTERGLTQFIGDMRQCASEPSSHFDYLDKKARAAFRSQIVTFEMHFKGAMPKPAGLPPVPWDQPVNLPNKKFNSADIVDGAAIAALTSGQLLWHAVALDRSILAAADFSRSLAVGDPLSFAAQAHNFAALGAQYALRGYTAERLVMDSLVAAGHDVVLPAASNMPGFDMLVDGAEVQVKCGTSLSILADHFKKYPDIPVIANSELAQKAADLGSDWSELVSTIPGFDLEVVQGKIDKALHHASELVDIDVLVFALAVGLVRGGYEVWRGAIPIEDLPAWMLIDGATRGALGFAGNAGGAAVGLLAIGPAGAVILGPAFACAALMGNGAARNEMSKALMKSWHDKQKALASQLHAAVCGAVDRKILALSARLGEMSEIRTELGDDAAQWLRRKASDDLIAAIEEKAELKQAPKNEFEILTLLIDASKISPTDAATLSARSKLENHFGERPSLSEAVFKNRLPKWPLYGGATETTTD